MHQVGVLQFMLLTIAAITESQDHLSQISSATDNHETNKSKSLAGHILELFRLIVNEDADAPSTPLDSTLILIRGMKFRSVLNRTFSICIIHCNRNRVLVLYYKAYISVLLVSEYQTITLFVPTYAYITYSYHRCRYFTVNSVQLQWFSLFWSPYSQRLPSQPAGEREPSKVRWATCVYYVRWV